MLDPRITSSLKQTYESLQQEGQLISAETLADCYSVFRTRFGPEVLAKLEGEELLNFIHARPSKDSLVYWLEFKNDNEFLDRFGSIAGGSSLKFGVYWSQEDGEWIIGSAKNQKSIPTAEAVEIATKQRDQLLAAVSVLEKFPKEATDADYAKLQEQMDQIAPAVSGYAWGHKYLGLVRKSRISERA
jgi:5-methylcytosine-specific restriction protein B